MTVVRGAGAPVTFVAHGLGAPVAHTRPLVSGIPGTKVFHEARGHGRPWTGQPGYAALAADLLATADEHGATQALGVSLGAGSLLRLLADHPSRFTHVVLYLPAALDAVRADAVRRGESLTYALSTRDEAAVSAWVRGELPPGLEGRTVDTYVAERSAFLLRSDLVPLLEGLRLDVPVPAVRVLREVTAEVLVIAEHDDPVHPLEVAEAVVAALPKARLAVLPRGALVFSRDRLIGLIANALVGPSGSAGRGRLGDAKPQKTQ